MEQETFIYRAAAAVPGGGICAGTPSTFRRASGVKPNMIKRFLSCLLAAAMMTLTAPTALASSQEEEIPADRPTGEISEEPEASSADPDRLTISILGDSNSAYYGWSEGAAADTTNSTIRDSEVYFEESDIAVENMWWYIAAQELGAEILVNNSWSGSCVFGPNEPYAGEGTDGCGSRSVNLHDDTGENAGEEPDIIVIFLGTDDCTFHWTTIGSAAQVDHETLITETADGVYYEEPTNSAEAYAIMLDKITRRYPNASVFCMTVLPRRDANIYQRTVVEAMNDIICTEAERYGAVVIDIYEDSGITSEIRSFDHYMMDLLHPNEAGMARIAEMLVSAVQDTVPAQPEPSPTPAAENAPAILRRHLDRS